MPTQDINHIADLKSDELEASQTRQAVDDIYRWMIRACFARAAQITVAEVLTRLYPGEPDKWFEKLTEAQIAMKTAIESWLEAILDNPAHVKTYDPHPLTRTGEEDTDIKEMSHSLLSILRTERANGRLSVLAAHVAYKMGDRVATALTSASPIAAILKLVREGILPRLTRARHRASRGVYAQIITGSDPPRDVLGNATAITAGLFSRTYMYVGWSTVSVWKRTNQELADCRKAKRYFEEEEDGGVDHTHDYIQHAWQLFGVRTDGDHQRVLLVDYGDRELDIMARVSAKLAESLFIAILGLHFNRKLTAAAASCLTE